MRSFIQMDFFSFCKEEKKKPTVKMSRVIPNRDKDLVGLKYCLSSQKMSANIFSLFSFARKKCMKLLRRSDLQGKR